MQILKLVMVQGVAAPACTESGTSRLKTTTACYSKRGISMELIDIRKMSGLNRSKFAERYGIPYRTLQDWELGHNKVPEYIKNLLERVVRYEFKEKD